MIDPKIYMQRQFLSVQWSEEDNCYICRCLHHPSLATHGEHPEEALGEMRLLLEEVGRDFEEDIDGPMTLIPNELLRERPVLDVLFGHIRLYRWLKGGHFGCWGGLWYKEDENG